MAKAAPPKNQPEETLQTEVKISLMDADVRKALAAFRLEMIDAVARDVYFFDTHDFSLSDAGLVLRARKTSKMPDDVTVKLRPMKKADIRAKWHVAPGFKSEVDIVGERSVESCSLTREPKRGFIENVVIGESDTSLLFSAEQQEFVAQNSKILPEWSKTHAFGPIHARIWKLASRGTADKVTVELWRLPNNHRLLEFSVKGLLSEADQLQKQLDAFVGTKGFVADASGDTKTRMAVKFFKGR